MNSFLLNEAGADKKVVADKLREMSTTDTSLSEILEVVRIAKETQEASGRFEDKNRRVFNSRELRDDLNVVRRRG